MAMTTTQLSKPLIVHTIGQPETHLQTYGHRLTQTLWI